MGAGDRKEAGAGSGKKRKEVSASDVKEASASDVLQPAAKKTAKWTIAKWRMHGIECEGGEVLRRKKEADDALPLWTSRDVPGAVELWNYPDLSEEKLAERSASYRQLHALRKFIDDKMMYYEQALIDQGLLLRKLSACQ
ncbi:hypothetical protein E2562_012189 [Oryza meyeriana var. granulata]|uniref:Uncharacterized protein n=1 Tax=Oryza meyeriana var. granulata TaxID=110450 RepID=A0A6G1F7G6_9ORYZ|nr:hypothetical protein E2562_012189 [Oryza meyeriana var. granulata]